MDEIFSLDFFKKTVTYQGEVLPTGTLACEALNITEQRIAELTAPTSTLVAAIPQILICESLEDYVDGLRDIVFGLLEGLSITPPFHRLHIDLLKARADSCLTASTARKLARDVNKIDFRKAVNSEVTPAEKRMLDFQRDTYENVFVWAGFAKIPAENTGIGGAMQR